MIKFKKKSILASIVTFAVIALSGVPSAVNADPVYDRVNSGKSIRIGFANEVPWAYPGKNNEPMGFSNAIAIGVLNSMGYKNIEPVITDWGGLIPGLNANRFDIITGGMYILKKRCENVNFSEPIGKFSEGFIVPTGNPKGLETYEDIKNKNAVIVTVAGFSHVAHCDKLGIPKKNVITVPSPTEVLAAVKVGRADIGGLNYFTALNLAKKSGGAVEVTDPNKFPDWTFNWVGIGFLKSDKKFLADFNVALKKYMGTPEMLDAVKQYGYTAKQLPGDATTAYACENR
jgi:polar amino acid transport system substrate-binding protein